MQLWAEDGLLSGCRQGRAREGGGGAVVSLRRVGPGGLDVSLRL